MSPIPTTAGSRPRGLFVNFPAAKCSIYESGRMFHAAIRDSERYALDYLEVRWFEEIPRGYEFYAFNYHLHTMRRMDTARLSELSGVKLTFVLEVFPNDPFILCPDHFDAYCVADPTMRHEDSRVYGFPRPLSDPGELPTYDDPGYPVIGSFGFATPGKRFQQVVAAAGAEFDRALVRLHLPAGSFADPSAARARAMADECRDAARPGIDVEITHHYMDDR